MFDGEAFAPNMNLGMNVRAEALDMERSLYTRRLEVAKRYRLGDYDSNLRQSIVEVVRHLVEGDRDTFLPRLRRMLTEMRPTFDKRAPVLGDATDLPTLAAAFASAREQALKRLLGLDEAGWRREGVSPSRGLLDVHTYATTMDAHDTEHLRQVQDVRATLGLRPKRCEARAPLPLGRAKLPSCPRLLAPQQKTLPSLVTAQV